MAPLQPKTVAHLRQVYLTLAAFVFSAAVGSYVQLVSHVGGFMTLIATFASLIWFFMTPHVEGDTNTMYKRFGIVMAFSFLQGVSLGPLLEATLNFDNGQSLILSAFVGTTIVFGCFSVAALFTERRSILFTAGVISSLASVLFWTAIVNIFVRSVMIFDIRLYLGLAMFCLFIVFDTQIIIYDCQENNKHDVVHHALEFFLDFINVFVRLLILLSKKGEKKSEKKK